MKYLIVEAPETGMPSAILFAENLTHRDVAGEQKVLSAGFCDVRSGQCWGRSESLGLSSQASDRALVAMAMSVMLNPVPVNAARMEGGGLRMAGRSSCRGNLTTKAT